VEPAQTPPPARGGRGSRQVIGPFTGRQLSFASGVVLVCAVLLFVATRPIASGPGSVEPTPIPLATPFLVGSPATGLRPGDVAPELAVKGPDGSPAPLLDLNGNPVRLADLRGRLVLLNFWATWCPPCQSETPVLRDLDQAYRSRGLSIIGIAVQETTPADVAAYAAKYGLQYTIAFDGSADVFHTYKVYALPTQVLIAPDGRVIEVINGPLTDAGAGPLLEPLLPIPASATPSSSTGASAAPIG
jgi:thiol-disulfide isomerase/thioredoxin